MGDFKERVKYRDQDDLASKGWGEAKASPFNPNGITLSLNSGWGQAAGWGNTGFDGGMDEGGMDDFTLHSPLPALTPKPAATLINAHSLMLDSLMQGKKLTGTKYLPGQVLEDADLLTHSLALQKQADEAAGVNQTAASNLKPLLQKHQTLASSATLPQQQAWHLHKGLQLLQDARDEGIIPGEDAEHLGDSFKRSLAQDQANLLLNKAPHAIAQALHTNPLLVGLNEQDRQRLEQRAERRLHSLPLDQQHQQQQALLQQTGNHLKNWFTRSYDYLGKAGQLSPSELADLELTQALPQHTLNLLAQLSAHAVKQSAKHQAYLNRILQGFKDQPLDPHNPDDQQAADYHFLLNHGKDSDQQLAGALPDLFRLTKIIPKSAKPALSRLIHGRDGVKFSQRLADVWQSNPSLAAQLPDEVLAHNFAASTILPDWQLGGAADPHNRLYYLLTSPILPPVPTSQDPAILGQQTAQRIIALRQLQDDLKTLEYQAAHHPDQMVQARLQPLIQARRDTLAQLSADPKNNVPQNLRIISLTQEQVRQRLGFEPPRESVFKSPTLAYASRHSQTPDIDMAFGIIESMKAGKLPPDFLQKLSPHFPLAFDEYGQLQDPGVNDLIDHILSLSPEQLAQGQAITRMDEVLKLPVKGYEGKEMDGKSLTYLATVYGVQDLNNPEISPDPNAGAFGSIRSNDLLYDAILQTIKAYHSGQLSYPQFKEALHSLRTFRPDEKLDNLGRLFLPEEVTPNQQLGRDLVGLGVDMAMAIPAIRVVGGALKYGGIGVKKAVEFLFPQLATRLAGSKIAATAAAATAEAMQGLVTVTQAVDRVADTASLVSIFAKHPAIAPYVQNLLFASSDEQAKRYLDDLTNMGFGELGLILAGIYKPRRTRAMNAASGNGAKTNPNIHQSQGNTNIPTNPGNGLPNTATTPGNITTSGNITTPGNPATALNPGAVTPGNNIGHQPLNPSNQLANPNNSLTPGQANLANPQSTVTPGQQATTPNSSQTPLQNNIGTVQPNTKIIWHEDVYKWNPNINDKKGGHVRKHLLKRQELLQRANDPTEFQTFHYFSSFENEEILTNTVRTTLQNNTQEIDHWLLEIQKSIDKAKNNNQKIPSNFRLILESKTPANTPIGFGVPRGSQNFEELYKTRMVLESKGDGEYYIFTAYPTK